MKRCFVIVFYSVVLLYSCKVDCEKSSESYRNYNLEVILTERPFIHGDMNFVGTKLNSDEVSTTKIMGRWYRDYKGYMDIGDTIIKRKGELTMYIHKKDTTMVFKWDCQGKVYE